MSNNWFNQFNYTLDKGVCNIFGVVNIGATGAPTLQKWKAAVGNTSQGSYAAADSSGFRGIKTIIRNSAGNYIVTLLQPYQRLMSYGIVFQGPNASTPAAPVVTVVATGTTVNTTGSTNPTITFVCQSSTGTPADQASGEVMLLNFVLQNSSAQ